MKKLSKEKQIFFNGGQTHWTHCVYTGCWKNFAGLTRKDAMLRGKEHCYAKGGPANGHLWDYGKIF